MPQGSQQVILVIVRIETMDKKLRELLEQACASCENQACWDMSRGPSGITKRKGIYERNPDAFNNPRA